MNGKILVLNAGSSSVKFQLFESCYSDAFPKSCLKGLIEGIGTSHPNFAVTDMRDEESRASCEAPLDTVPAAVDYLTGYLDRVMGERPAAVGHRVVHGGANHASPRIVDDILMAELEALIPLAPLHQPNNLLPIKTLAARDPSLVQIACFDTAFHRSRPAIADRFALPRELHERGIRRYGFHGLSYEWITRRLREISQKDADSKIIIAHLGSGASLCAVDQGRAVDSTMGFTALDGLPMGTRVGALDPGVVLHLLSQGMTASELESLLYKRSGLLGVSGISSDLRDLLASQDPAAQAAVDLFVHRIVREIGALAAVMQGLDALIFTAGIGERSAYVRSSVCNRLRWLGLDADEDANAQHAECISQPRSRVRAYVVPTDEERMIAIHCLHLLRHRQLPEAV